MYFQIVDQHKFDTTTKRVEVSEDSVTIITADGHYYESWGEHGENDYLEYGFVIKYGPENSPQQAITRSHKTLTYQTRTDMSNLTSTKVTLSGILSRHTSAEFSNVNDGNTCKVHVYRHDVTFDEFMNILGNLYDVFGEQYVDFDEDSMMITFTIDLNHPAH